MMCLDWSQVKYVGFRDRPLEERQMRFAAGCQEGHTEIVSLCQRSHCTGSLFLCCAGQHPLGLMMTPSAGMDGQLDATRQALYTHTQHPAVDGSARPLSTRFRSRRELEAGAHLNFTLSPLKTSCRPVRPGALLSTQRGT